MEDIENSVNIQIYNNYPDIKRRNGDKESNLKNLQNMFLLDPELIKALHNKIKISDSDEVILRKIYAAEATISAQKDAELKNRLNSVEELNTTDNDYQEKLQDNYLSVL